jgi:hypothetical protein
VDALLAVAVTSTWLAPSGNVHAPAQATEGSPTSQQAKTALMHDMYSSSRNNQQLPQLVVICRYSNRGRQHPISAGGRD